MTAVLVQDVQSSTHKLSTHTDALELKNCVTQRLAMSADIVTSGYPDHLKAQRLKTWRFTYPDAQETQIETIQFDDYDTSCNLVKIHENVDNVFVYMIWQAYCSHLPLIFSPDDIWLVILQGFGRHIAANASALRSKIVSHEEKMAVVVDGTDFIVPGSENNDWQRVAKGFEHQLGTILHNNLTETTCAGFSGSGSVPKMSFQIALMGAMQHYVSFNCVLMCGIPSVTLDGTVEDWKQLRTRAQALAAYDLEWWIDALLPVLDMFVLTAQYAEELKCLNVQDSFDVAVVHDIRAFWSRIALLSAGSGPQYMSGWITLLFPYTRSNVSRKTEFAAGQLHISKLFKFDTTFKESDADAMKMELFHFPSDVSEAPFVLDIQNLGIQVNMKFMAGFFGIVQNPQTQALRVLMGWSCANTKPLDD